MAEEKNYLERLKDKWGIKRNIDFVLILIVFALTGTSAAYLGKPILKAIPILNELPTPLYVLLRLLIVLPIYQLLLLMFGFIFGQFNFFWNFEKKTFNSMKKMFRKKS